MSTDVQEDQAAETALDQDTDVIDEAAKDEAEAEKQNAATLKQVENILAGKPAEEKTKQAGGDEESSAEGTEEKESDEAFQALADRAKDAGIPDDLAERLHQNGLLEESLAAMDRKAIEGAVEAEDSDEGEEPAKPPKKAAKLGTKEPGEDEPVLDPELEWEDSLVARDAYLSNEIAELKAQVAQLSSLSSATARQRDDRFQDWFAEQATGLKNAELFGGEDAADGSPQHKNRQTLCNGYERLCVASGVDPYDCHVELLRRAYPAMFSKEVFKAAQRDTVRRLRDAEGKFIHPSRASGGVPSSKKRDTPEQANDALVKQVEGILNKSQK